MCLHACILRKKFLGNCFGEDGSVRRGYLAPVINVSRCCTGFTRRLSVALNATKWGGAWWTSILHRQSGGPWFHIGYLMHAGNAMARVGIVQLAVRDRASHVG